MCLVYYPSKKAIDVGGATGSYLICKSSKLHIRRRAEIIAGLVLILVHSF